LLGALPGGVVVEGDPGALGGNGAADGPAEPLPSPGDQHRLTGEPQIHTRSLLYRKIHCGPFACARTRRPNCGAGKCAAAAESWLSASSAVNRSRVALAVARSTSKANSQPGSSSSMGECTTSPSSSARSLPLDRTKTVDPGGGPAGSRFRAVYEVGPVVLVRPVGGVAEDHLALGRGPANMVEMQVGKDHV